MKTFLSFLLFFPSLAFAAEEEQTLQKTLFSAIIAPFPGEFISFTTSLEDEFLGTDSDARGDNAFEIKGVSQPYAENIISIITPIPDLISSDPSIGFLANKSGGSFNFSWTPRDVFFSPGAIFTTIVPQVLTDPGPPSDFWKIVERNETLEIPATHIPSDITYLNEGCHGDTTCATSCPYKVWNQVYRTSCSECGVNYVCAGYDPITGLCTGQVASGCKACNFLVCEELRTRTLVNTKKYSCEVWWEGWQDEFSKVYDRHEVLQGGRFIPAFDTRPASHVIPFLGNSSVSTTNGSFLL